jgi:hypothetical protein
MTELSMDIRKFVERENKEALSIISSLAVPEPKRLDERLEYYASVLNLVKEVSQHEAIEWITMVLRAWSAKGYEALRFKDRDWGIEISSSMKASREVRSRQIQMLRACGNSFLRAWWETRDLSMFKYMMVYRKSQEVFFLMMDRNDITG